MFNICFFNSISIIILLYSNNVNIYYKVPSACCLYNSFLITSCFVHFFLSAWWERLNLTEYKNGHTNDEQLNDILYKSNNNFMTLAKYFLLVTAFIVASQNTGTYFISNKPKASFSVSFYSEEHFDLNFDHSRVSTAFTLSHCHCLTIILGLEEIKNL